MPSCTEQKQNEDKATIVVNNNNNNNSSSSSSSTNSSERDGRLEADAPTTDSSRYLFAFFKRTATVWLSHHDGSMGYREMKQQITTYQVLGTAAAYLEG